VIRRARAKHSFYASSTPEVDDRERVAVLEARFKRLKTVQSHRARAQLASHSLGIQFSMEVPSCRCAAPSAPRSDSHFGWLRSLGRPREYTRAKSGNDMPDMQWMTMKTPIEFYFDFTSPYSYLASEMIESLAMRHDRSVAYRPTLLGAAFKVSGQRALVEIPMKGDYSRRDLARCARFYGIPFQLPEPFPVSTVTAARCCLVLEREHPPQAVPFIHQMFRAFFVQGRNISEAQVVHSVLAESGANATAVLDAAGQSGNKEALKAAVDASIARGVFGAPFFFLDEEPFWGCDRLPQMERWLASGAF
jgi:2-hydroxychromene-2-carboxylate isomerase